MVRKARRVNSNVAQVVGAKGAGVPPSPVEYRKEGRNQSGVKLSKTKRPKQRQQVDYTSKYGFRFWYESYRLFILPPTVVEGSLACRFLGFVFRPLVLGTAESIFFHVPSAFAHDIVRPYPRQRHDAQGVEDGLERLQEKGLAGALLQPPVPAPGQLAVRGKLAAEEEGRVLDDGPHARVEVPASPGGVCGVGCGVWERREASASFFWLRPKQETGSPIARCAMIGQYRIRCSVTRALFAHATLL